MSEVYNKRGWVVRLERTPGGSRELAFTRQGVPIWRVSLPPKMQDTDAEVIALQITHMCDAVWSMGFEKARRMLEGTAEANP